jgi:hypothetical protein
VISLRNRALQDISIPHFNKQPSSDKTGIAARFNRDSPGHQQTP